MRLRFSSMDQVRELDGILYEEDGDIVAHDIPISLGSVELDGEATDIADCVCRASTAEDGGEADKEGRLSGGVGEDAGVGHVFGRLVKSKGTESSGATGVDDSLRDTFMVKTVDLTSPDKSLSWGWYYYQNYTFSRPNVSSKSIGPV
jgi:hypothetical protein